MRESNRPVAWRSNVLPWPRAHRSSTLVLRRSISFSRHRSAALCRARNISIAKRHRLRTSCYCRRTTESRCHSRCHSCPAAFPMFPSRSGRDALRLAIAFASSSPPRREYVLGRTTWCPHRPPPTAMRRHSSSLPPIRYLPALPDVCNFPFALLPSACSSFKIFTIGRTRHRRGRPASQKSKKPTSQAFWRWVANSVRSSFASLRTLLPCTRRLTPATGTHSAHLLKRGPHERIIPPDPVPVEHKFRIHRIGFLFALAFNPLALNTSVPSSPPRLTKPGSLPLDSGSSGILPSARSRPPPPSACRSGNARQSPAKSRVRAPAAPVPPAESSAR